jgi:hypothetical protein
MVTSNSAEVNIPVKKLARFRPPRAKDLTLGPRRISMDNEALRGPGCAGFLQWLGGEEKVQVREAPSRGGRRRTWRYVGTDRKWKLVLDDASHR